MIKIRLYCTFCLIWLTGRLGPTVLAVGAGVDSVWIYFLSLISPNKLAIFPFTPNKLRQKV